MDTPSTKTPAVRRWLAPGVLALLFVLNLTGALDWTLGALGKRHVEGTNRRYLTEASRRSTQTFLMLTVLKTGLDIIEGSTVGVSLGVQGQVEAGDVVQSFLDMVDLAWKVVLAGMVALFSLQLLLSVAAALAPKAVALALVLAAVHLAGVAWRPAWRRVHALTATLLAFGLTLALTLHAALPLAVYGAARLSQRFTAASTAAASAGVDAIRKDVLPAADDPAGALPKAGSLTDRLKELKATLALQTRRLTRHIIALVTAYLFDCVLFPLGFFALLYWLIRAIVVRLVGASERRYSLAELESVLRELRGNAPSPSPAPGTETRP